MYFFAFANSSFGIYFNNEIIQRDVVGETIIDENTFVFNLESNGRLKTPMKFELNKNKYSFGKLNEIWYQWSGFGEIFDFRDLFIRPVNDRDKSFCRNSNCFVSNGIDFPLCGRKSHWDKESSFFDLKRLVIIQME